MIQRVLKNSISYLNANRKARYAFIGSNIAAAVLSASCAFTERMVVLPPMIAGASFEVESNSLQYGLYSYRDGLSGHNRDFTAHVVSFRLLY